MPWAHRHLKGHPAPPLLLNYKLVVLLSLNMIYKYNYDLQLKFQSNKNFLIDKVRRNTFYQNGKLYYLVDYNVR